MERLTTGIAGLDQILGGGLPTQSMVLVSGGPGTGKSMLAQSAAFTNANAGREVLYFTTVAEPLSHLLRFHRRFPFFTPDVLGHQLHFVDLAGSQCGGGNAGDLVDRIRDETWERDARLVVIDGFRTIAEMVPDGFALRTMLYELAMAMSRSRATLLLTGDYPDGAQARRPEFTVADGIVQLAVDEQKAIGGRSVQITKMRGVDFTEGRHPLEIGNNGLQVFPRRRGRRDLPGALGPYQGGDVALGRNERLTTGLGRLDQLLGGGMRRGSTSLITGPAQTGKTALLLQLTGAALAQGERVLLLSLQTAPEALVGVAGANGLDLVPYIEADALDLLHAPPGEVNPYRVSDALIKRCDSFGFRVVLIDDPALLTSGLGDRTARVDFIHGLLDGFDSLDATVVVAHRRVEGREVHDGAESALCERADSVILTCADDGASGAPGLTVIKAQGRGVDAAVYPCVLGPTGMSVRNPAILAL